VDAVVADTKIRMTFESKALDISSREVAWIVPRMLACS
jgi:hypothetical protein